MERLQKVLAHAGVASRRKCEEFIINGRVKVNGQVVLDLGTKVDPQQDRIEVDGTPIHSEKMAYYLFYKPTGVITSVTDTHGRKVVTDFFQEIPERIYPVGRLDNDTSGLLIMTNDGDLAYRLMHPSFTIDKIYLATVEGIPSSQKLKQLEKGVLLEDGWTSPAVAEIVEKRSQPTESVIRLTIHEGRKRQVRRMCQHIGHTVKKLHREKYGFLTLKGLKKGEYRELSSEEVTRLKEMVTQRSQL
ncbi:pseudouridine synthase [Caldalkalibacillus mannanilyticus]|uniref:pseudouridine synthase n=1 Tax=Caldalkalibacillus mannanilyticus TaxID=1418 RepID=UPI0004696CDE|nr:pseudouridine synthase [Caldalkalibacillus mannanilyticus]